jgi:putative salt-induced outer membrane protein
MRLMNIDCCYPSAALDLVSARNPAAGFRLRGNILRIGVVALGASMALPAAASDPNGWAGDFKAGYIQTSGNSDTSAGNVKAELDYTYMPWANSLTGAATNGSQRGTTTEERYSLGDKLKFNFNEVDYAFGDITYDNDRFGGIQQSYTESVGYGRRLLMTEHQTLDAEVGVGAGEQRRINEDNYRTQFLTTVGGKYVYHFSETSQFSQTLRTEIGTNNTFVNPISELKLSIVKQLFATIDYEVRYNTTVPDNTKHTDTITSVNFGYSFGKIR